MKIVQKCIFPEMFLQQYLAHKDDVEDPSSENVQDMKKNNLSKYHYNPMEEGGVIVVRVSAINISSLQPLSKLSKPSKYLSFITHWLFLTTIG
jgi:hypothetical protein